AALTTLDAAIKADPGSLVAVTAKANALVQQHRPADAIAFVEDMSRANRKNPGLLVLLGNLYADAGKRDKAAAAFQQALDLDGLGEARPRARAHRPRQGRGRDRPAPGGGHRQARRRRVGSPPPIRLRAARPTRSSHRRARGGHEGGASPARLRSGSRRGLSPG